MSARWTAYDIEDWALGWSLFVGARAWSSRGWLGPLQENTFVRISDGAWNKTQRTASDASIMACSWTGEPRVIRAAPVPTMDHPTALFDTRSSDRSSWRRLLTAAHSATTHGTSGIAILPRRLRRRVTSLLRTSTTTLSDTAVGITVTPTAHRRRVSFRWTYECAKRELLGAVYNRRPVI